MVMRIMKVTDIWSILSAFTLTKIKPKLRRKLLPNSFMRKRKNNEWSYVDDISDIKVSVVEIESDMAVDIELGGYCE